jgi:flagellin-like protein
MTLKMVNKKAISPVITTILLVMISLAAVAIVASFVIPYVQDLLKQGDCFKAIDQIEIDTSSVYTCYQIFDPTPADSTNGDAYTVVNMSVKRGAEALGIEQFVINVYGEGRSEKFDIKKETRMDTRILMYGPPTLAEEKVIEIPERRAMLTYSLNTVNVNNNLTEVTSVEISPVVKGNIFCDAADRKVIEAC